MTNTKKNKAQQITKSDKDHCIWPEGKVQVCKIFSGLFFWLLMLVFRCGCYSDLLSAVGPSSKHSLAHGRAY